MRQYFFPSRSVHLAVLVTVMGGALCPAAAKFENSLRRVTATPAGGNLIISMDATGDYRYEQFELSNPKRLVIDLIQINNEVKPGRIPFADQTETVKDITVAQFRAKNPAITRVTMTLGHNAGGYNIAQNGSQMRVVFKREAGSSVSNEPQKPTEMPAVAKAPPVAQKIVSPAIGGTTAQTPPSAPEKAKTEAVSSDASPAPPLPPAAAATQGGHFQLASMQPNPRKIRVLPAIQRVAEPTVKSSDSAAKSSPVAVAPSPSDSSVAPKKEESAPVTPSESQAAKEAVSNTTPPAGSEPVSSPAPIVTPKPSQLPVLSPSPIRSAGAAADSNPMPVAEKKAVQQVASPSTPQASGRPVHSVPSVLPTASAAPKQVPVQPLSPIRSAITAADSKPAPVSSESAPKPSPSPSGSDSAASSKTEIEKQEKPTIEKAPLPPEAIAKKEAGLEDTAVKVIAPSTDFNSDSTAVQAAALVNEPSQTGTPNVTMNTPAVLQRIPLAKSPEEALASTFSSPSVLPTKSSPASSSSKPLITRAKNPSKILVKPGGSPQPLAPPQENKPPGGTTTPSVPGTAEIRVSQPTGKTIQSTTTQYMGEEIDLKVKDLDLVDFFRMMSEISGLNISVDPDVSGKITMQMNAVPWDQIFDLALSTHKLERKIDGNVVRVSRKQTLQDEEKAIQSLKAAQLNSLDVQTTTIRLNYSNAEEVILSVEKQLSGKGTILSDKRTNTLIITDIPPKIQSLTELIRNLDTPEKQVRIEARVVQAARNFAREVGVNLGFLAGNGERVTVGGPPVRNSFPSFMNENVSLAGVRRNGQIGIKVGSILDTFQLDAAIQAGEQKGLAKLISRPSVSGQNNREAVIRQGVRFPIQTIQNNTISIQYQDASLTLRVTPLITHENTILMKLKVENNVADFTRVVNGIPSIKTNESETMVLVADGGTTVIGGILVDDDRNTMDSVPGLSSIPVFGNLFKKRNMEKRTEEVLFFITPSICP